MVSVWAWAERELMTIETSAGKEEFQYIANN
jgi:hypothetical protein